MRKIPAVLCALFCAASAPARVVTSFDYTWSHGPVHFVVNVTPSAGSADAEVLRRAVAAAAERWNGLIERPFFQLRFDQTGTSASGNDVNEIAFAPSLASSPYFAAVAIRRKGELRLESDVQINPSRAWFFYHGPLRHEANGDRIPDLYRVMLHELGHIVGLRHAQPESAASVMRAHMSDVDDFTPADVRDARAAIRYLFQRNAPRILWPPRYAADVRGTRVVLRGTGRPFFVPVVRIRIPSAAGSKTRHLRVRSVWQKSLQLKPGTNRLRFSYRLPGGAIVRFAARLIRVR